MVVIGLIHKYGLSDFGMVSNKNMSESIIKGFGNHKLVLNNEQPNSTARRVQFKKTQRKGKRKRSECIVPGGPMMVETHSWRLSPLGPAKQLQGGSTVISESSFCILLAEEVMEVAADHCRELPAHPLIGRTDRPETDRQRNLL